MHIANKMEGYPDDFKTIRQWSKEGMLPKKGIEGTICWSNSYCQIKSVYYRRDEVEQVSKDKLREFRRFCKENKLKKEKSRNNYVWWSNKDDEPYKSEEIIYIPDKRDDAYEKRLLREASKLNANRIKNETKLIVIDIESTGLNPDNDEIIQISIINGNGNIILNSLVKPYWNTSWVLASNVNHITTEMVKNAPSPDKLIPIVKGSVESAASIVFYGKTLDMDLLSRWGVDFNNKNIIDVAEIYAKKYSTWDKYFKQYRLKKLKDAAKHYGYSFKEHDSLEDAKATLFVFNKLIYEGEIII